MKPQSLFAGRASAIAVVLPTLLAAWAAPARGVDPAPRIVLTASAEAGYLAEIVDLSDQQLAAFDKLSAAEQQAVFELVVDSEAQDLPPLTGTLSRAEQVLRFSPRYPLEAGVSYRARLDLAALSPATDKALAEAPLTEVLAPQASDSAPTTVVTHIYPTADELPENQLKFYIHFSAPMSRGEAYQHVHLLDENDREVEGAFLELGEELWDADQQRFTLLFDPGRVKRGLKPREELGPVLVEGRSYSLVVDNAWRDATRTPLNAGARKHFRVGPPDEEAIDTSAWQLMPPAANSRDPLLVRFGEPLDHSLLERIVRVVNAAGEEVPGTIVTGDREACWQFTPREPWTSGRFQLVAESTLEDLAGNSIGRPFEVDQFDRVDESIETRSISIPFIVGEP